MTGRNVYIVDDDATLREWFVGVLNSAGFALRAFNSPVAFLNAVPKLAHGCILIDMCAAEEGFKLQEGLNQLGIDMPTILMMREADVKSAVRAMKAGAVDFIEKPFSKAAVLRAVEEALAERFQLGGRHEARAATRLVAHLSAREREVLQALAAGRSNKQIAFDLGISIRTVEVHRSHMMERLGVRSLAEAIRIAVLAVV